jgi:hypothetical protein
MIVKYLNKYFDGTYTRYDLIFEENNELLLRLSGLSFLSEPSIEEIESVIIDIARFNLPDYEINQITTI